MITPQLKTNLDLKVESYIRTSKLMHLGLITITLIPTSSETNQSLINQRMHLLPPMEDNARINNQIEL